MSPAVRLFYPVRWRPGPILSATVLKRTTAKQHPCREQVTPERPATGFLWEPLPHTLGPMLAVIWWFCVSATARRSR